MNALERNTLRALLVVLTAALLFVAGACVVDTEHETEIEQPGADVEVEHEADGDVEIERESRIEDDLDHAGEQLAEGARRVDDALERASERIERRAGPFVDDAMLTARVKARLIADPEINPFQIDVDTVDGTVTLNGMVDTDDQRAEAEKLASRTPGVTQVINVIRVGRRADPA
jgi:hyperosmotically inducible protein